MIGQPNASLPVDRHAFLFSDELKVREPRSRDSVLLPTLHGGKRRDGKSRYSRRATEGLDQVESESVHVVRYATIADYAQARICDISSCDIRSIAQERGMTPMQIRAELDARGMSIRDLAEATGINENFLAKSLGKAARRIQVHEMEAIKRVLAPEPDDFERIRTIPLLGKVPAGKFQPAEQIGGRRVPVSDPETPPRAYALRVDGDSMDLITGDGTTLVIDPDDIALYPGRRYVVRTLDGETTFKEYQEGPARLVPCSSNPAHREIMLGAEPIEVLGRVWSYMMRDAPRRSA